MKLALAIHEYPPVGGGASTAAAQTARALADEGHDVLVITAGSRGLPARETHGRVTVERLPGLRGTLLAPSAVELISFCAGAAVLLEGRMRKFGAEAVLAYFAVPVGPFAVRAARSLRIPAIVSLRGSDVPGFKHGRLEGRLGALARPVIRWTLDHADAIAPNSEVLRDLALAFHPSIEAKLRVVPNGIEVDAIADRPAASGLPGLRVIQVGQLIERKRVAITIDAIARVPGAHLTVIGDGPLRAELEARARGANVTFLGHLPRAEILTRLRAHDVFVMTSVAEGMSNALVEAMAAGLPVVTTPSGSHDVIDRSGGGVVVPGEAHALAAILAELAASPARRDALARAALSHARGLTWQATARGFLAFLGA